MDSPFFYRVIINKFNNLSFFALNKRGDFIVGYSSYKVVKLREELILTLDKIKKGRNVNEKKYDNLSSANSTISRMFK